MQNAALITCTPPVALAAGGIFQDKETMRQHGGCVPGRFKSSIVLRLGGEPDPDDDGTGPDHDDYGEESGPDD